MEEDPLVTERRALQQQLEAAVAAMDATRILELVQQLKELDARQAQHRTVTQADLDQVVTRFEGTQRQLEARVTELEAQLQQAQTKGTDLEAQLQQALARVAALEAAPPPPPPQPEPPLLVTGFPVPRGSLLGVAADPLRRWLPHGTSLTLLFTAQKDGWAGQQFHAKCDGKGPTVVLLHSTTGCVFGGYAAASWEGGGGAYIAAPTSFIFTISNPYGIPPTRFGCTEPQSALYGQGDRGPLFGAGCDIYVNQDMHTGGVTSKSYPVGSELGSLVFAGGKQFSLQNVEVYAVVANQ
eukprot:TRINITY_DN5537_c0_g1_i6.p1 TRINITY_DN5537_c0_g1~~TRINITY_DN5537_c0_g1_i6.p1  ORF type:complete len:308 (-),score=67.55 TRINITY_DN5537_c0_g1_i6:10-897(-)